VFVPVAGGWGRRGSTNVRLSAADPATLKNALRIAWENVARKTSAKRRAALLKKSAAPKRSFGDTDRAFARAVKAAKATKLPGIEEGTSYGTPSLTVRSKFLMRVKDPDTLVFRCTMEEKAFLMEAEPSIYFETDHYVGWPAVLVRLSVVSDAELAHCVTRAWRLQAPKKLKAERANASPAKQRAAKKK
jgi:hypothetical protein